METHRFTSFDGREIAYYILGEGRPTLLLHGFLSRAFGNWFDPGIAEKIAATGRRVIAPDLRGHGRSDAPTEADAWPRDVLAMDQEALLLHLGVSDFDLVGYSLGARTAVRMMVRGAHPGRGVLAGMGDAGVLEAGARATMFEDAIRNGERAANPAAGQVVQAMLKGGNLDPDAMLGVLASFVPTTREDLAQLNLPILVVSGERDDDNGSAEGLAALLPNAQARRVPGNHLSAVGKPELAEAIVQFLGRS